MYWKLCTADQLREFYAEFNVTEEMAKTQTQKIQKWLAKDLCISNGADEDWLENFLFRCKFDKKKAKQKLQYYFTSKSSIPEIFENLDPSCEEVKITGDCAAYVPMPRLTPEGYRIFIFRFFDSSLASRQNVLYILKAVQMLMDFNLKNDKHRAVFVLFDMENVTITYLRMTFTILRKLLSIKTKINPMRFHKILILNLVKFAEPIVYVSKKIMPKKIADRIEIWKRPISELSTTLPLNCLPVEYGGNLKSIVDLREDWIKYFHTSKDWFTQHEKIKANFDKKQNIVSEVEESSESDEIKNFHTLSID